MQSRGMYRVGVSLLVAATCALSSIWVASPARVSAGDTGADSADCVSATTASTDPRAVTTTTSGKLVTTTVAPKVPCIRVTPTTVRPNVLTPTTVAEPVVAQPPTLPEAVVTLGDSYAAGMGSSTYLGTAPSPGPSGVYPPDPYWCGRATDAPGAVAADALGLRHVNLACGGAQTQNIWQPQAQHAVTTSQLEQLRVAASTNRVKLVYVMIGGNDTNWVAELSKCHMSFMADAASNLPSNADDLVAPCALNPAAMSAGVSGQVTSAVAAVTALMDGLIDPKSGKRLYPDGVSKSYRLVLASYPNATPKYPDLSVYNQDGQDDVGAFGGSTSTFWPLAEERYGLGCPWHLQTFAQLEDGTFMLSDAIRAAAGALPGVEFLDTHTALDGGRFCEDTNPANDLFQPLSVGTLTPTPGMHFPFGLDLTVSFWQLALPWPLGAVLFGASNWNMAAEASSVLPSAAGSILATIQSLPEGSWLRNGLLSTLNFEYYSQKSYHPNSAGNRRLGACIVMAWNEGVQEEHGCTAGTSSSGVVASTPPLPVPTPTPPARVIEYTGTMTPGTLTAPGLVGAVTSPTPDYYTMGVPTLGAAVPLPGSVDPVPFPTGLPPLSFDSCAVTHLGEGPFSSTPTGAEICQLKSYVENGSLRSVPFERIEVTTTHRFVTAGGVAVLARVHWTFVAPIVTFARVTDWSPALGYPASDSLVGEVPFNPTGFMFVGSTVPGTAFGPGVALSTVMPTAVNDLKLFSRCDQRKEDGTYVQRVGVYVEPQSANTHWTYGHATCLQGSGASSYATYYNKITQYFSLPPLATGGQAPILRLIQTRTPLAGVPATKPLGMCGRLPAVWNPGTASQPEVVGVNCAFAAVPTGATGFVENGKYFSDTIDTCNYAGAQQVPQLLQLSSTSRACVVLDALSGSTSNPPSAALVGWNFSAATATSKARLEFRLKPEWAGSFGCPSGTVKTALSADGLNLVCELMVNPPAGSYSMQFTAPLPNGPIRGYVMYAGSGACPAGSVEQVVNLLVRCYWGNEPTGGRTATIVTVGTAQHFGYRQKTT